MPYWIFHFFRYISFHLVSFRFVLFRFGFFRYISFRYILLRFVTFFKSANQKQELPVAAMFLNGSGQNVYFL
jgi:hypothetical protein